MSRSIEHITPPHAVRDQIERLERSLDDQADLIRRLAHGMRHCFQELNKDLPDIDRAKDSISAMSNSDKRWVIALIICCTSVLLLSIALTVLQGWFEQ